LATLVDMKQIKICDHSSFPNSQTRAKTRLQQMRAPLYIAERALEPRIFAHTGVYANMPYTTSVRVTRVH